MARREVDIPITAEGRDRGKVFRLTEMPATQAEKWAARAFLAMARAGVEVPDDIASAGLAGLASYGLRALAGVHFEDAEPLMDEMMACIKRVVNPASPIYARALNEDDIEEIGTRLFLRREIVRLHTDFSFAVAPSIWPSATAAAVNGAASPGT